MYKGKEVVMATLEVKQRKCMCERCGHMWVPRNEVVVVCPKCKSYKWNEPKNKKEERK